MVVEVVLPLDLHHARDGHRYGRQNQTDPDSLEVGDAVGVGGEAAEEGDEGELVEGDEEGHEEQGDDGDGGLGHLEPSSQVGVHGGALLDRHRLELGQARVHDDGAHKNWHHPR